MHSSAFHRHQVVSCPGTSHQIVFFFPSPMRCLTSVHLEVSLGRITGVASVTLCQTSHQNGDRPEVSPSRGGYQHQIPGIFYSHKPHMTELSICLVPMSQSQQSRKKAHRTKLGHTVQVNSVLALASPCAATGGHKLQMSSVDSQM